MLSAKALYVQAHTNASSVFDAGVDTMSVKLTIKRMQGYAAPKKATKLNMALISRLKLLGKAARDKASLLNILRLIPSGATKMHAIALALMEVCKLIVSEKMQEVRKHEIRCMKHHEAA